MGVVALHLLPERDCARCTKDQQAEWGCHARKLADGTWENAAMMPLRLDDEELYVCPRRPIKDDPSYFERLLFHHGLYRQGLLPEAGGTTNQPYRALKLFQVVDHALAEVQEEQDERRRRQQARR